MEIRYQSIQLQHLKINQTIIGTGQPVVLLHGWGANIPLVYPLAERLAPLGYCVYMLDLPGFGQSDPPPHAWSVFDYADFVRAYWDYHQLERCYLFGHSFGGRLGLILGAEHGKRIIKMALADSAGIVPKTPLLKNWRLKSYKFVRDGLYGVGATSLANQLRDAYNARYGSSDLQQVSGVMRETFIKVVNQDLLDYAARVKPPTILFWGEKDEDTPLWYGQLFEKTIPDTGLIVHAGAGHYSYLDKLAETVRIMDVFFKQQAEGAF